MPRTCVRKTICHVASAVAAAIVVSVVLSGLLAGPHHGYLAGSVSGWRQDQPSGQTSVSCTGVTVSPAQRDTAASNLIRQFRPSTNTPVSVMSPIFAVRRDPVTGKWVPGSLSTGEVLRTALAGK